MFSIAHSIISTITKYNISVEGFSPFILMVTIGSVFLVTLILIGDKNAFNRSPITVVLDPGGTCVTFFIGLGDICLIIRRLASKYISL